MTRTFPATAMYSEIHDRFFEKVAIVDDDTSCWEWTGRRLPTGPGSGSRSLPYGRLSVRGHESQAHRIAWEIANGHSVPTGMLVMHDCDNPPCVRPDHLLIGTHLDNMRDKMAKGRHRSVSIAGEANACHKLSDADIIEIRRLSIVDGVKYEDIGARFNVGASTVCKVVTGGTRPELPFPDSKDEYIHRLEGALLRFGEPGADVLSRCRQEARRG